MHLLNCGDSVGAGLPDRNHVLHLEGVTEKSECEGWDGEPKHFFRPPVSYSPFNHRTL